jgi:hypothetical protein
MSIFILNEISKFASKSPNRARSQYKSLKAPLIYFCTPLQVKFEADSSTLTLPEAPYPSLVKPKLDTEDYKSL